VVWTLGTISGVILFFGILASSALEYGETSGCISIGSNPNPAPCTPQIQQVILNNPLAGGSGSSGELLIGLLALLIGLPAWIGGPILARRRGSSSRTAILIVSVIACAIGIVGVAADFLISPALTTPETCISSTAQTCFYGDQAKLVALLGIGFGSVVASLLIGMPAWVMALTETAGRRSWGWFIAVLCTSPFGALLYSFLGAPPASPRAAQPGPALSTSGE
jgi:hypothetical protein